MAVDLDAVETVFSEGALEQLFAALFSRKDGAAGHDFRVRDGELQREIIQGSCHAGLVRVGEDDASIDSASPERGHRFVHADSVLDGPGVLAEPSADRLGEPIGKEMHVRIDDHEDLPFADSRMSALPIRSGGDGCLGVAHRKAEGRHDSWGHDRLSTSRLHPSNLP